MSKGSEDIAELGVTHDVPEKSRLSHSTVE